MEYCDRGCLGDVMKRGVFRPAEGRWGSETSMRALVRTGKEMAQVGEEGDAGGREERGSRRVTEEGGSKRPARGKRCDSI